MCVIVCVVSLYLYKHKNDYNSDNFTNIELKFPAVVVERDCQHRLQAPTDKVRYLFKTLPLTSQFNTLCLLAKYLVDSETDFN